MLDEPNWGQSNKGNQLEAVYWGQSIRGAINWNQSIIIGDWAKSGQKKARSKARFFWDVNCSLDSYDVLGLWAFLALGNNELNALAFGQGFVARHCNGAEMCEHIWAAFACDEAKTFAFIEPFNGSGNFIGHGNNLFYLVT
jgi:hypothetical protein